MADRRRFIAERTAELQAELNALTAESVDLDIAERVLRRFSDSPTTAGATENPPVVAPNDAEDGTSLTLPQMVFVILEEAKATGRAGADGSEILRVIRARWRPDFTPDKVRPTLWRMVKKEGRLKKRGKLYVLPTSSPHGETGAVAAPASL
jgi:hypothetical protein